MADFHLHFNNDEDSLLTQGKQTFGGDLGTILKTKLREAILEHRNTDRTAASPDTAEPQNTERIRALFDRHFGDIPSEYRFIILMGGRSAAETALQNRLRTIAGTHPAYYAGVAELAHSAYPSLLKPKTDTGTQK